MDAIWTGFVAGAVTAAAAVIGQLLTQRVQRKRLTEELEHRTQTVLRELEHQSQLLTRELEYQTRAALRETYTRLLVSQRQSREASLRAAKRTVGANESVDDALGAAVEAHTSFIEHYHQLNLDVNREMWLEARGLRAVLDDMLKAAKKEDADEAALLYDLARDARQNLERSFRLRLGHEALQKRTPLGKHDEVQGAS